MPTGKFDYVSRLLAQTKSVFGQEVFPLLDPSRKLAASFVHGSKYFQMAAEGIWKAELAACEDLLIDLRDHSVPGVITEFGIFQGEWLSRLYDLSQQVGLRREVWGFDSFQGLSTPDGTRDVAFWKQGMFSASIDEVRKNLRVDERPEIRLVEGFFSDSLPEAEAQSVREISFARIDCDIYQPAVECLACLSNRLSHGAVLVLDDWSQLPDFGETRAFFEWTAQVPHLDFEFLFYGMWDHFYIRAWHRGKKRWDSAGGAFQAK